MHYSNYLVDILEQFEGFKSHSYKDVGGNKTIGFGTRLYINIQEPITMTYARKLLIDTLDINKEALLQTGVVRNEYQLNALLELTYNIGMQAFYHSTLFALLKAKANKSAIEYEFRRWVYVKGKRKEALTLRREWDIREFFKKVRL